MTQRPFKLFATLVVVSSVLEGKAWAQEAPRSFATQNGLLSDERFDAARRAFEEIETPATGLGAHFNESSSPGATLRPT